MRPTPSRLDMRKLGYSDTMTPPMIPETTGFSAWVPAGGAKLASSQGMNTASARISLPLLGSASPLSTVAESASATGAGTSRCHNRNAASSARETRRAWKAPSRLLAACPLHAARSLLGAFQALLVSLALLAAFLLWHRLVPAPVALALSATVLNGLAEPSKGNEILALAVFIPWLLASFAPPAGTQALNPVVSGIIGGVMVSLYPNFLMSSLLGVGLMLVVGWRSSERPRTYLVHAITV